MRPSALFRLYQLSSVLALPFLARHSIKKLRKAGIPVHRAHERLGHTTQPSRLGHVIWFRAASVGEAKSVLPLMDHLAQDQPSMQLILTTETATSAKVVTPHLSSRALHQFAPLDGSGPVKRFLDHWRPNLCVLVESELWPNQLDACARRNIPVALVNARLSDTSAQAWRRFPATTRYVLRGIKMAHCQSQRARDHLRAMGLGFAQQGQNLKAVTGLKSVDPKQVAAARTDLENRPVWVAASTHEGEEKGVLAAHKRLLETFPNLCLILVPRHPERAQHVRQLINTAGLTTAQRSRGDKLTNGKQVYLADTIGETSLWYSLSPITFLGGSWTDAGGHNPYEAAAEHTAILHGPKYDNFAESYEAFQRHDASVEVADNGALSQMIEHLLTDSSRAAQMAANARPLAQSGEAALKTLAAQLLNLAQIEHEASQKWQL